MMPIGDRHGSPRFYELVEQMADTHERKNRDYSPGADALANFRRIERFGVPAWVGCLARWCDKLARMETLIQQRMDHGVEHPAVADESLFDTMLDLANYTLILQVLIEEEQNAAIDRVLLGRSAESAAPDDQERSAG